MSDQQHTPPTFSIRLIRALCRTELVEEIEGNLYEYYWIMSEEANRFSKIRFWIQVLTYLRPSTLKFFKLKNSGSMFIFNPKIAVRSLFKHRVSTSINLLGFVIGLLSTIFIYFYINTELNIDSFHVDKENIYRVIRTSEINGAPYDVGVTSGPYAEALINDYPSSINSTTRAFPQNGLVKIADKKFQENKMIFADKNFFEFFSYPLAEGNPGDVLSLPNSVVISREIATKYFGFKDPIGEIIEVDNEYKFTITGIMDDLPAKSHLDFNMVFSIELFEGFDWFHGWWNNGLVTYINVPTPQQAQYLNTQFPDFMDKYFGDDFEASGTKIGLQVEPLEDIYFNNKTRFDPVVHGDLSSLIILGAVGVIIIFIACFNYINLSIAMAFKRAKEVSVRKVLGVEKTRLITQFLGESMMLLLASMLIAIGLSIAVKPIFNSVFDLDILFNWADQFVITFMVGLMLVVLITSGLYPALLMSSFKPVSILKSGKILLGKNSFIRKGLVVAQFSLSIFLIIATLLIGFQLDYMKSKPLGYNKESLLIIHINNQEIQSNDELFKNDLLRHENIKSVTSASGEPGGFHDGTVLQISGVDLNPKVRSAFADTDYLKTLGIPIAAGRDFDRSFANNDSMAMMINEKALAEIGLTAEEAIGRKVTIPGFGIDRRIVAVVKDYHFTALNNEIEPQAIIMGYTHHRRFIVRMNDVDIPNTLRHIEESFNRHSPNFPITYQFHDEGLDQLYADEQKQARVFSSFSGISIFLACMGIFGLAAYAAEQRQKELGIRKILGASVQQVILIISKEFITLVVIAAVVAMPLTWIFMKNWLHDFAYRIGLAENWMVFILGSLVAGIIAFLTIALKTYKTAASNPTDCIRYE